MIDIQIYRNVAGEITGFAANGHANTAPRGQDIVCAGVASLTQTAALGLQQHLAREVRLEVTAGKLILDLVKPPDALSGAILETMVLGLAEIAKLSPQSVRIVEHRR
ncbi:MAG TPA: ribosomal-processing cysteine protease Prp [Selenomonadales bacterium]|nr:ribosomal-processing cysteine protease Prp [Selenomonadales bacterium]